MTNSSHKQNNNWQAIPKIMLFDGVCNLCNTWVGWLIFLDKKRQFKLASVQSEIGQEILAHHQLPLDQFESFIYLERGRIYQKSQAFFRIIQHLGFPIGALGVFRILPNAVNDWCYDRIAKNRYRWFGKKDQCPIPTAHQKSWFLDTRLPKQPHSNREL